MERLLTFKSLFEASVQTVERCQKSNVSGYRQGQMFALVTVSSSD